MIFKARIDVISDEYEYTFDDRGNMFDKDGNPLYWDKGNIVDEDSNVFDDAPRFVEYETASSLEMAETVWQGIIEEGIAEPNETRIIDIEGSDEDTAIFLARCNAVLDCYEFSGQMILDPHSLTNDIVWVASSSPEAYAEDYNARI